MKNKLYGIPMLPNMGLPFTPGDIYHVMPHSGSDSNLGVNINAPFKSLEKAQEKATANQNDVVLMYAESNTASSTSNYLSAGLDWAKDMVHLIGVNSSPMIGHRSRVAALSTVLDIEDMFTLSADGCMVKNIEFFHGVTGSTATAPRCMVVSGQRNVIENCQISGMGSSADTNMDVAGGRSLAVVYPSAECLFKHCYIGLDTCLRATNVIEMEVAGTGASTRVARTIFEDCVINTYTSSTTGKLVYANYIDRFLMFKNCMFCAIEGITSAAVPTGAISDANVNGKIWVLGGGCFGPADLTTADDTNVRILTYSGLAANVVDQGVAKSTDVAA